MSTIHAEFCLAASGDPKAKMREQIQPLRDLAGGIALGVPSTLEFGRNMPGFRREDFQPGKDILYNLTQASALGSVRPHEVALPASLCLDEGLKDYSYALWKKSEELQKLLPRPATPQAAKAAPFAHEMWSRIQETPIERKLSAVQSAIEFVNASKRD